MQTMKREAVDRFWQDYVSYSCMGLAAGCLLSILTTRFAHLISHPIKSVFGSPVLPLYAGIAGGVALSELADKFNRLKSVEDSIAGG